MSFTILNPQIMENLMKQKLKDYDEIKQFIKNNPYPNLEEMSDVLDNTVKKGLPVDGVFQFYWKDIVQELYENICDEDITIRCGQRLNNGLNSKDKSMGHSTMIINYSILESVLEYNYNKKKSNKKYDKQKIMNMMITINYTWDSIGDWGS